jgi:O-antigen/teichoic acid export membrane protein
VFNQGSTLAMNLFVANLLGREIFGKYSVVQSTAVTALQLAQFATGYTATKYVAENRLANPERASRIMTLCGLIAVGSSFIAAIALVIGGHALATDVLHVTSLAPALRWSAGIVFFGVNSGFLTGALTGLEEYRALGLCGVAAGTLYSATCAIGAALGGLDGAIVGLIAAYLGQAVLLAMALRAALPRHRLTVTTHRLRDESGVLFRFAIPAALGGLSGLPALWLASAALVRTSDGLNQVAIYAAAFNLRIAAGFVPNVMNGVGLAVLNNERGHGDAASYRAAFWTNWGTVVGFATLAAGALALLAPFAMRLFGRDFVAGSMTARILLVAAVIEAISLATCQVLHNRERLWLTLVTYSLPRDLVLVALAFVLSGRAGAVGLAMAYLSAQVVSALFVAIAVGRIGVRPFEESA